MNILENIEKIKKSFELRDPMVFSENQLLIGPFRTYGENKHECFYVHADINTHNVTHQNTYLKCCLSFWEEVAKEQKQMKLVISPTVFNYFLNEQDYLQTIECKSISSRERKSLEEKGLFYISTHHKIKYLILDQKEHDRMLKTKKEIKKFIKNLAKKEVRTNMDTLDDHSIFFHFSYRETSCQTEFLIEDNHFYLIHHTSKKRYSVNSFEEIQTNMMNLLNDCYNRQRIIFTTSPPKSYFNNLFSFLNENNKHNVYQTLLQSLDFNKIEDLCFLHKKKKTNYYEPFSNIVFFYFSGTYFLCLESNFRTFPKEKYDEAKKTFETFVFEKLKKQMDEKISAIKEQ